METRELELYNQMVGTGTDNAKMAVEWLMSKSEAAGGVEPNLLSGKSDRCLRERNIVLQQKLSENERPSLS